MKTKLVESRLADLTPGETTATYGGTVKPDMIIVPFNLGRMLGEYLADRLKEYFNG